MDNDDSGVWIRVAAEKKRTTTSQVSVIQIKKNKKKIKKYINKKKIKNI